MLSRAWLTIAQHVFQPVLTGGPELISRKIVSGEPGTKAIAVSRFREKLSPANWVQGVTAISRKISRSWAPKKWGPTCDRDISNSAIYTTAIYRAYTVYENDWHKSNQLRWKWIIVYFTICSNIITVFDCHKFNIINIYKYRHICFLSHAYWVPTKYILLSIQTVAVVVSSVYHELFTLVVQHKRYTSVILLSSVSLRLKTRHQSLQIIYTEQVPHDDLPKNM